MLVLLLMLASTAAGPLSDGGGQGASPASPDSAVEATVIEPERMAQIDAIRATIRSGRLADARALLTAIHIADDGPESDDLTLLEAELRLAEGDASGAEKALRGLPPLGRFRCPVLRIAGRAALDQHQTDRAIDQLGRLANECTPDWRDWTALGRGLADAQEADASRYAFAQALDRTDRPAQVHGDFGQALMQLGRIDDAAEEYRRALAIDPADMTARDGLDMIGGTRGLPPERAETDSDQRWSQRLAKSAEGARDAGHDNLARALFAQAAIAAPRYDERLVKEATKP